MRTLVSALIFGLMFGCSTPRSVKPDYLTGDASFPVKKIEGVLARDAGVYKLKPDKLGPSKAKAGTKKAPKPSKSATHVSVRMIPITKPLITSRLNEELNARADREIWKAERLRNELRNAISTDVIKYVSGKQCFDTYLILADAKSTRSQVPKELDPQFWSGTVMQDDRTFSLSVIEGPRCVKPEGRLFSGFPFRLRFNGENETHCRVIACTSVSVNLHKGFSVEYRPRFDQNLLPVVIAWPGTEIKKINSVKPRLQASARK